jgi:hypothetical protein
MRNRLIAAGFAAPLLFGLWLATPGSPARPTCAFASGAHHVAVVVEHGGGAVRTACVAFDAVQLTGQQVMQLSGIEYATTSYGGLGNAVCQVDNEPGSYPPSCWTATSPYWAMYVSRSGGAWAVSSQGVSSQQFRDGDALGWHYVPQIGGGGGPPPSPAGVCSGPGPLPTATTTTPAPPPAASTPAPAAPIVPAPDAVASAASSPAPVATESAGIPSPSPTPSPNRSLARKSPAGDELNLGWAAAALAIGSLAGLLLLQLLLPLLRR